MIPKVITDQLPTIWNDAVNATLWMGFLEGILALFLLTVCIVTCCFMWRRYKEGDTDEIDIILAIVPILSLLLCTAAVSSAIPDLMAPEAQVYQQLFSHVH